MELTAITVTFTNPKVLMGYCCCTYSSLPPGGAAHTSGAPAGQLRHNTSHMSCSFWPKIKVSGEVIGINIKPIHKSKSASHRKSCSCVSHSDRFLGTNRQLCVCVSVESQVLGRRSTPRGSFSTSPSSLHWGNQQRKA